MNNILWIIVIVLLAILIIIMIGACTAGVRNEALCEYLGYNNAGFGMVEGKFQVYCMDLIPLESLK